jgi:anti-sigma factor RsiW
MNDIAAIVHSYDEDLEMYVRGRLEPQHMALLDAHLLECEACRTRLTRCIGLQLTLHPIGVAKSEVTEVTQRRCEPRFHTGDDAIFQQLSPLSLERQAVRIVDISRNGVGLLAPGSALPGTIVQLRIVDTVEIGEVRYCSARGTEGYRIGLRLHPEF